MQSKQQFCNSHFRIISRAATAALAIATMFALTVVLTQSAQAQTFKVLHTFTGSDGAAPEAGLTMDAAGNLYGTTTGGGACEGGTVFELKPWHGVFILNSIFTFNGNNGSCPYSGVVFGPDGVLYGTTSSGGSANVGVVYSLRPGATACKTALCPWTETILYQFSGGNDGEFPGLGNVTFDAAGNLYGTTIWGGPSNQNCNGHGCGVVYELTPSGSGWTESVPYSFTGGNDGSQVWGGVIFDQVGSLYGTAIDGGNSGWGIVYQLTPSGSGWKENILYSFQGTTDGALPEGDMVFDKSGNLYGTTGYAGAGQSSGTVFELTPGSGGSWIFNTIYSFPANGGGGPVGALSMDAAGNLYGTTVGDGLYGYGSVFKLTPSSGGWTYTSLHDFTGGSDGGWPFSNVIWDSAGNLYGTAEAGGNVSRCSGYGCGVIWEITP